MGLNARPARDARACAEQQMGEMRGILMPQGSARYEEPMHLRSLWEETREIQARFVQEGMGQVIQQVNDGLLAKWGGVGLSSRSGLEFGEWRLGHLVPRNRQARAVGAHRRTD